MSPTAPTALVLGGGGVLGAAEIGMLRALLERNVVPDVIVGSSVGALNREALYRGELPITMEDVRRELISRNLACWCPLGASCHADVLLDVANDWVGGRPGGQSCGAPPADRGPAAPGAQP